MLFLRLLFLLFGTIVVLVLVTFIWATAQIPGPKFSTEGRVAHFSGEYTLSREPLAAKMKGVPHFSWFSRSAQQTACTTSS